MTATLQRRDDRAEPVRKSIIAPNEGIKPDVPNVQQALATLQGKALVWKERRGVYALEEATLADLMVVNGLLAPVVKQGR